MAVAVVIKLKCNMLGPMQSCVVIGVSLVDKRGEKRDNISTRVKREDKEENPNPKSTPFHFLACLSRHLLALLKKGLHLLSRSLWAIEWAVQISTMTWCLK